MVKKGSSVKQNHNNKMNNNHNTEHNNGNSNNKKRRHNKNQTYNSYNQQNPYYYYQYDPYNYYSSYNYHYPYNYYSYNPYNPYTYQNDHLNNPSYNSSKQKKTVKPSKIAKSSENLQKKEPKTNQKSDPFSGLFSSSDCITISVMDDGKNGPPKLDDIFKTILGISNISTDNEPKKKKMLYQEYDLTKDYIELDSKIESIDDLIKLGNLYDPNNTELMSKYTIDLKKLSDMREPLEELQNLIGMDKIKKSIVRQIIYFLQGIEEQEDMLHMIITGGPGIGKTSLGVVISKLYYSMGLLDKNPSINPITGKQEEFVFKIYKRSDLIGQYLGQTAIKTQKAIDECQGGIMFLDEAYSLGHDDKSDIYTKECLDTINQNLSEKKKNFIMIIAGYPEQLDKCFFSHNEGLKRRFAFRYDIDKYKPEELASMLLLKIKLDRWSIDENIKTEVITKIIEGNKEMFSNFGGDVESWLLHIKIEHGTRIFGKHPRMRRVLNIDDINNGLKQFKIAKENKSKKEKEEMDRYLYNTLYS